MKRDWNQLNLRDAYKPVPEEFRDTVKQTAGSLGIRELMEEKKLENRTIFGMTRRFAFALIIGILLIAMAAAYALTRYGVLDWLDYETGSTTLGTAEQEVLAEGTADYITARITGIIFDGKRFALSYELENDEPELPALVVLDDRCRVNGQQEGLDIDAAFAYPVLVPDAGLNILPVQRNPVRDGAFSHDMKQKLSGEAECEVVFHIYRPEKQFVIVEEDDWLWHPENEEDEETRAEYQDVLDTLKSFRNTIIADPEHLDAEAWQNDGYTVIDPNFGIEGPSVDDVNLKETAQIPVTFRFSTDAKEVYDFSDMEDVPLTDGTLSIRTLRFSPLTTEMDLRLFPKENTKEAAEHMAERYGRNLELTDEQGEPVEWAGIHYDRFDWDYEPHVRLDENEEDRWACCYTVLTAGIDTWPESIGIGTEQGEILRVQIRQPEE